MAKVDMSLFRPLKFAFGKIHVSGGQSPKALPVTSKQITAPSGENITFVRLATSENWLLAATTGVLRYTASSFGRTSLLDELRAELQKHCDGLLDACEGAPEPVENDDDYDPMAEVAADSAVAEAGGTKTVGRGLKRNRYHRTHRKKTVVRLTMPVRCKEEDPNCTEMRNIRMYVEDRKQLWLDLADVDWCVKYLYIQNHLKGVPLVSDDSTGPGSTD